MLWLRFEVGNANRTVSRWKFVQNFPFESAPNFHVTIFENLSCFNRHDGEICRNYRVNGLRRIYTGKFIQYSLNEGNFCANGVYFLMRNVSFKSLHKCEVASRIFQCLHQGIAD